MCNFQNKPKIMEFWCRNTMIFGIFSSQVDLEKSTRLDLTQVSRQKSTWLDSSQSTGHTRANVVRNKVVRKNVVRIQCCQSQCCQSQCCQSQCCQIKCCQIKKKCLIFVGTILKMFKKSENLENSFPGGPPSLGIQAMLG